MTDEHVVDSFLDNENLSKGSGNCILVNNYVRASNTIFRRLNISVRILSNDLITSPVRNSRSRGPSPLSSSGIRITQYVHSKGNDIHDIKTRKWKQESAD